MRAALFLCSRCNSPAQTPLHRFVSRPDPKTNGADKKTGDPDLSEAPLL